MLKSSIHLGAGPHSGWKGKEVHSFLFFLRLQPFWIPWPLEGILAIVQHPCPCVMGLVHVPAAPDVPPQTPGLQDH